MRIIQNHVYPPIPIRSFDWEAYDENKFCCPECGLTVGRGPTRLTALLDLWDQMVDELEDQC